MKTSHTETRWWRYVTAAIGDMNFSTAAQVAGFDKSAFTRWKGGAKADPAFVLKFARAFDLNALEALVEADFLSEEEAQLNRVLVGGVTLDSATDIQLAEELLRRAKKLGGVFLCRKSSRWG